MVAFVQGFVKWWDDKEVDRLSGSLGKAVFICVLLRSAVATSPTSSAASMTFRITLGSGE